MTQLEILKLASIGICARIEKEKEINENTIKDLGRENDIALHHIKNMEQQFDEIMRLIGIAEQRGGYSPQERRTLCLIQQDIFTHMD